ncbi:hypothetical protein [Thiohalomonas denitrificans]|uniref:hypothetical protein n=1 Tax=Thiohalomonas denitrificans TaxID=415747 RepID=UPI0026EA868D|nr:hypothetical protein [Thiohalomonas denitrificans]
MKPRIHATAGAVAMLCILSFWTSTAISELFLSHEAVVWVKQMILYGLWVLIPAMAITGGSGFSLASGRSGHFVEGKKRRMRFIALNGLVIMVPTAFFLFHKATAGEFDTVFYAVQAVELLVGIAQLFLMTINFRDGLVLAGRFRAPGPELSD